MIEIEKIFLADSGVFTIFVVEQRFVVGRGRDYFNSFINKPNFFDSDEKAKRLYKKIIDKIEKSVAPVSSIVAKIALGNYLSSLSDIVTSLCKLFTVTEHQAAGPDVIDPIIIQEGKVSAKALTKLVHLHKDSILRPSIIILLQDNDFERAKSLLSECPDGINAKMIRNNGEEILYKIINCGAEDVSSFITSYSEQCYSTCSNTKREVLLNSSWTSNQVVSTFSPLLFRYRSNLLFDQKEEVIGGLGGVIFDIAAYEANSASDDYILKTLECVAKLYRVFCNDHGGQDIVDAQSLAKSLENEVLQAQVYKCADLMPNCSRNTKFELYEQSYKIFKRNNMEDHAIYSRNNMLIEQFYSDYVAPDEFYDLFVEAINNVPGMVGLPHIYNNVGVAYLYCGQATEAIDIFNRGLAHATNKNRVVQTLALESNKMLAESYSFCVIDENRIRFLMRQIFDGMGIRRLPFLAADYMLNTLSVAYRQNSLLGAELIDTFPVKELIDESFRRNALSASERILQMQYLASKYPSFSLLMQNCNVPIIPNIACGKRKEFILRYGFSPFDFSTWM